MGLIQKIKQWYASEKEIMEDRRIIRRYNYLKDKLNRLSKKGEPEFHVKGYSKALDEFRSIADFYLPAMRRESARLEELNGYKNQYLEKAV